MIDLSRRKFLTVFAPAVVVATNIMPVRSIARLIDPQVVGVHYQSWLLDEPRSAFYHNGAWFLNDGSTRPLSEFIHKVRERYGDTIVFCGPLFNLQDAIMFRRRLDEED